jgi:hypothetical protein
MAARPKLAMHTLSRVKRELAAHGLLLRADPRLPSVAGLVAGETIRGSWWSHPLAHPIYDACQALERDPDAILVKLVAGKVTYVHRRLWPALLAIGTAAEPWQTRGLSASARSLLRSVEAQGIVRTDALQSRSAQRAKLGAAARELEARLLVYADEVHTESGAHGKQLEAWSYWSARTGVRAEPGGAASARDRLDAAVRTYAGGGWRDGLLPWGAARPAEASRAATPRRGGSARRGDARGSAPRGR